VSRGVYGRSTRRNDGANRRQTDFFLRQVGTPYRYPARDTGIDAYRPLDGRRGGDRNNRVVKIVVIPIARDPRRVWGIGEGGGRDPDKQGRKQ